MPATDLTYRQPDVPGALPGPDQVAALLDAADFTDFTQPRTTR